jgi:hypothetical protein
MLRNALSVRKKGLRNVGMAPEPKLMRPWEPLGNPDHCAQSWQARVEQMGISHVARHRSDIKITITDLQERRQIPDPIARSNLPCIFGTSMMSSMVKP